MAMTSGDYFTKKLVSDVQSTFTRLQTALKSRETQLLRQIDVIIQQYKLGNGNMKCFNKINVVFDNEVDILKAVSNFGIIDFEGISLENNIYKIEDYENPSRDHVCLYKCLDKVNNVPDVININLETGNAQLNLENVPMDNESISNKDVEEESKENLLNISNSVENNLEIHSLLKKCNLKQSLSKRRSLSGLTNLHISEIISQEDNDENFESTVADQFNYFSSTGNVNKSYNENKDILPLTVQNDVTIINIPSQRKERNLKLLETHMDNILSNTDSNIKDISDLRKSLKFLSMSNENSTGKDMSQSSSDANKNSKTPTLSFINNTDNLKSESLKLDPVEIAKVKSDLLQFHNSISKIFDPCLTNNLNESSPKNINNQTGNFIKKSKTPHCSGNMKKSGRELLIKSKSSNSIETGKLRKTERVRKISLEHPIQVQQWMKQIINEPEIEPVQNTELLEHVNISSTL